jgi:hypothetical protein
MSLILIEAPASADHRGTAGAGETSPTSRGGDLRRFSTKPQQFSWGIDRHARTISGGVLPQAGAVLLHRHLPAAPGPFLKAVAPDREALGVCVACLGTWDLAGRPLRSGGEPLRPGRGRPSPDPGPPGRTVAVPPLLCRGREEGTEPGARPQETASPSRGNRPLKGESAARRGWCRQVSAAPAPGNAASSRV